MTISTGFYNRFLGFTIFTVCFLILVGGIVRSTGSGMGCPDWPKCFGNWVPPTKLSQLPENYREVYANQRHQKNLDLASYLELLGFSDLSNRLRNDQSILEEAEFNATKTWIEYLNRLLGVIVGFLFVLNVYLAFRQRSTNRFYLKLALLNLFLVIFQGWVGSVVVSTNLLGGMITFHMLLALLILAVLIYNYWISLKRQTTVTKSNVINKAVTWSVIALGLLLVQVVLGTQVRETIDIIAKELGESQRFRWIEELGLVFYVHRSYSILLLGVHLYFAYLAYSILKDGGEVKLVFILMVTIVLEILTGTIMSYFSIPAYLQPVHLLMATLTFSIDFYLFVILSDIKSKQMKGVEVNM